MSWCFIIAVEILARQRQNVKRGTKWRGGTNTGPSMRLPDLRLMRSREFSHTSRIHLESGVPLCRTPDSNFKTIIYQTLS